ncbi:hypothetical protein [Clostridium beijerinckii]|jgi:hypothetical protein|uniref:Uncharacterized protein n=2 Tax=Clostridium beijerinckii TaxID=1520 RepID=A0AAE2UXT3_CLOBE|nr:hypothetical protein [Clostridium beijerinckii]ABR36497.1 hypothetical protein Cbei_4388 [Clostridium beijerinckii NCIMB 8052]AIU05174.1 hypothetical protein Cbs_4388 [Clostridium beijerinckii ATCC 35702]MBF7808855.1 hypothetical protein [Clostridium beijerinckii]NOW89337.1 hypothetical protein [Clostridium beijerinckii]NRT22434.1 hypothetical protein [Clostridium beijerinckii]
MKSVFKSNKICISIIVFCTVAVIVTAIVLSFMKYSMNTYTITTEYQDRFLVKERVTTNYPDSQYDFELYDANAQGNNKQILSLTHVEDLNKNIVCLYRSNKLRCYLVSDFIVYKVNEEDCFRKVEINEFKNLNIDDFKFLIPVAKELFLKNWELAHDVAEFLVKCGDTETINILKRYENDDFNENELRINKCSIYSKKDIKEYSRSLLNKYKSES